MSKRRALALCSFKEEAVLAHVVRSRATLNLALCNAYSVQRGTVAAMWEVVCKCHGLVVWHACMCECEIELMS